VASATVTRQYANSSDAPIEAVYIFPLPHDAAVYDLEIRIGNRVIRSVIHEREQAKRVYEAAKAEGKRAALLEQERPNIFTASVANIMPNDQISVRVRYVQPLKWEDGRVRLVFPMVVGPRRATVVGFGPAYFLAANTPPAGCKDKMPLTFRNISVHVAVTGSTFDVKNWKGEGGDDYTLSVNAGQVSAAGPSHGVY
jgi:hypothetical protein